MISFRKIVSGLLIFLATLVLSISLFMYSMNVVFLDPTLYGRIAYIVGKTNNLYGKALESLKRNINDINVECVKEKMSSEKFYNVLKDKITVLIEGFIKSMESKGKLESKLSISNLKKDASAIITACSDLNKQQVMMALFFIPSKIKIGEEKVKQFFDEKLRILSFNEFKTYINYLLLSRYWWALFLVSILLFLVYLFFNKDDVAKALYKVGSIFAINGVILLLLFPSLEFLSGNVVAEKNAKIVVASVARFGFYKLLFISLSLIVLGVFLTIVAFGINYNSGFKYTKEDKT